MVGRTDIIRKLKKEKSKLLMLAKQRSMARKKGDSARAEERQLNADISKLKEEASTSFVRQATRFVKQTAKTARRKKLGKRAIVATARLANEFSRAFNDFRKFAKKQK